MANHQNEKQALRRELKARRDAMSQQEWVVANERLCDHVLAWLQDKSFRQFFIYAAIGREVDLCQPRLLAAFLQQGRIALPVVGNNGAMSFKSWDGASPLVKNKYQIPEPSSGKSLIPGADTIIFVPALSYSPDRHRIGYGKGYYDRFLGRSFSAIKIGICFRTMLSASLPHEKHDVAVDHLITD